MQTRTFLVMEAKYRISPTTLDALYSYINSDNLWERYWGASENPSISPEDFHEQKRIDLLNNLNRIDIPWEDSERADLGTAFNEIIDGLITKTTPKHEKLEQYLYSKELGIIFVVFNKRIFIFPIHICESIAEYCAKSIPQYRIKQTISTKYGTVLLSGYIDELLPTANIIDLKTTGRYSQGQFEDHFQHHIYPYAINKEGMKCEYFEYLIMQYYLTKDRMIKNCEIHKEYYRYDKYESEAHIKYWCELLIEFVEENKNLIINQRIFNK